MAHFWTAVCLLIQQQWLIPCADGAESKTDQAFSLIRDMARILTDHGQELDSGTVADVSRLWEKPRETIQGKAAQP
jgi:hypothetical protein